jgi:Zn-dependent peptidase ImmA (M78 family)
MTSTERSANALADLMLATMSATNKALERSTEDDGTREIRMVEESDQVYHGY